jgi:hypothetical protein
MNNCAHEYEEVDYPVIFGFSLILEKCKICGHIKPDDESDIESPLNVKIEPIEP